jgi:hypothetical protein
MNEETLTLMHAQMQESLHREARTKYKQAINLLEECLPTLYEYVKEDHAFVVSSMGSNALYDLQHIKQYL